MTTPKQMTQLSPLDAECVKGALRKASASDPKSTLYALALNAMESAYPQDWHVTITRSKLVKMGGIDVNNAVKFYSVIGVGQRVLVYKANGKWILPSGKEVPRELAPRTLRDVSKLLKQCGVTGA